MSDAGQTLKRRLLAITAVLACVAIGSGCNSKLLRPPAIVFADSGEYGVKTSIREEDRAFPSVFTAFLPSTVPLHPGDALNFQLRDTGEPHSVAMGSLINDAVEAFEALGPTATLLQIESLPAMKRVPSVFSREHLKRPRLLDSAAQRCFLDENVPATSFGGADTCADSEQPEFNGEQVFFSSGVLQEGEPFRIKLDDETPPGSYRFMCLVHRSSMTGTIEVRPTSQERPAVAQLREQANAEEGEVGSTLEPAARTAGTDAEPDGGPILAGTGPEGITRGYLAWFFDRDTTAKVGQPLTWKVHRAHTISFNPSREAKEGYVVEEGDGVRLNTDAYSAVGSAPPPIDLERVVPPKKSYAIDGGTWDGEGEWSSGAIRATPPTAVTYTMRFSKAGTYRYACLIHTSMRGKVIVE